MSAVPSASVVVPVFNGAATVGDMLSALVAQSGALPRTEIIVVDNGSTDATCDIVRRFDVTLLQESRRGPSAARNRGLHAASGEIIAHLDADTLPTRRWLAELIAPFSDSGVQLVAGKTLSFRTDTPVERYFARAHLYDAEVNVSRAVMPFAASLNMAVRRTSALAIGGWTEDMLTAEDVDFSYRLLCTFPSQIIYQPRALLFHRNRNTERGLSRQAWTYGEGVADLYRRYPDVLAWGLPQWWHLARNLTHYWSARAAGRIGRRLRLASPEQAEFAEYRWLWSRWFWRGFFSMYRHGVRRAP